MARLALGRAGDRDVDGLRLTSSPPTQSAVTVDVEAPTADEVTDISSRPVKRSPLVTREGA
jgi:hypothetical protein